MTGRIAAALVAAAAIGCWGGGDAPASDAGALTVLSETADALAGVRSGRMNLDVRAEPVGGDGRGAFGFRIEGPFAFDDDQPLPVAELTYTRVAGDDEATVTVLSTGEEAFVEVDGQAYVLPDDEAASLGLGGGGDGLILQVDRWVVEPVLEEGGDTDVVRARLDVPAALGDLVGLAGAGVPSPGTDDAAQLERAVRSSSLEVVTGADDRLLRRLDARVEFAGDGPLPGELEGVRLRATLELSEHGSPLEVIAPPDARPASELGDAAAS